MRRVFLFSLALLGLGLLPAFAEDQNDLFAERAQEAYQVTSKEFRTNKNDPEIALKFARACFHWASHLSNNDAKADIAKDGIVASRRVLELQTNSAAGHYYLGMNLGRLAQTKTLGALKLVDEMEDEFQTARDLDPNYSFAGPDRNLGLLYRDAPGWPASIGSKSKARRHLQRAVILAPDYPENRLNLIETYQEWGDKEAAEREIKALEELWDRARKKLTGEKWESDWADWENRLKQVKQRAGKTPPRLHSQRGFQ